MRIRSIRLLSRNSTLLGLLLTSVVLLLFMWNPALLQHLELLLSDVRFHVRGPLIPESDVVIAAIDEKSLDELGRWPWPYTVQADLVRQLTAYGAAAIGYDVVFSSPDTSAGKQHWLQLKGQLEAHPGHANAEVLALVDHAVAAANHDQQFAEALEESGRTILGYFFHWQKDAVRHLKEDELQRFSHDLLQATNARYTPRVAPGTSLSGLRLTPAYTVESNIPTLSQAAWGNGFFNSRADDDGVIRRYPLVAQYRGYAGVAGDNGRDLSAPGQHNDLFAPLGIRVLERYLREREGHANTLVTISANDQAQVWLVTGRQRYEIPIDQEGRMRLNYSGPSALESAPNAFRFPRYAIVDILKGRKTLAPPEVFRGKMVLVGATAVGLSDLRLTPFDAAFPGVETHATAIDTILRQRFLVEPWWGSWYTGLNVLLLGVTLTVVLPRLGALWGEVMAMGLGASSLLLNYYLFVAQGWVVHMVYPLLVTIVVWAGMTIYHYVVEQQGSRFLTKTFSTYLSPALVEQMIRHHTEPQLGGSSGIRTAYFTDIASFSSFSEVLTAARLVELLNG